MSGLQKATHSVAGYVPQMAKSLLAGAIAGIGALATALTDEKVTGSEWATIALATVVAVGGVWRIPNADS